MEMRRWRGGARSLWVTFMVLCAAVNAIPLAYDEDHGELVKLIDEAVDSGQAWVPGTPVPQAKTLGATQGANPYTFAGTLQHVANRFCVERVQKEGKGNLFCKELVALQKQWIVSESTGEVHKFNGYLGSLTGHYCPDAAATKDGRCLVLSLLTKAVPADLKWNADRKRYLQLTKDVAKHYCKVHGEAELFCPLVRGLKKHYFQAVNVQDSTKYEKYLKSLQKHYCVGAQTHKPDERCNIFPLLQKGLPSMDKKLLELNHGKVIESKHATPGDPPGDTVPIDVP